MRKQISLVFSYDCRDLLNKALTNGHLHSCFKVSYPHAPLSYKEVILNYETGDGGAHSKRNTNNTRLLFALGVEYGKLLIDNGFKASIIPKVEKIIILEAERNEINKQFDEIKSGKINLTAGNKKRNTKTK